MTSLLLQAVEAHRANELIKAEGLYKAALAEDPTRADGHYNLGMIYAERKAVTMALACFKAATEHRPDFGDAWLLLSEYAGLAHEPGLSASAAEKAVSLLPLSAKAWLRRGNAASALCEESEALDAYERSHRLDPTLRAAAINGCVILKRKGRYQEAQALILRALQATGSTLRIDEQAEADYSLLHWHLALLELAFQDYLRGFAFFRARFKGGTNWQRLISDIAPWADQDLNNKHILVTTEQGHGDLLMMGRYLPLLKDKGARITLQSPSAMVSYFADWALLDRVISVGDALPSLIDFHIPIFDLPYRFKTTVESLPNDVPYLPRPEASTALASETRPKIGVNWSGQRDNPRDTLRSIPLTVFAKLFDVPGKRFFSFTRELNPGDEALLSAAHVQNLSSAITDFKDSARWVHQMDLIITCDTALAHLAGGLGLSVWTLLPFSPDWRWGLEGESTAWYPTMRLFRQAADETWEQVVANVKSALEKIA